MRSNQTHSRTSGRGTPGSARDGSVFAGYPSGEGDDLLRARRFCSSATAEMDAIIAADRSSPTQTRNTSDNRLRQGRDPVWLCERLDAIQRGAKRARARAVYRSAQDVLGLIQRRNAHMPIDWTRVDGRLFVLNKLLGQYETGLSELEALILPATPSNDAQPDEAAANSELAASGEIFDPVDAIARETLRDLLPHASEAEQAALTRLMDFDPQTMGDSEAIIATETLEPVLPELVQRLLEVARQYGKTLSVSHSLDDMRVADGAAQAIADRIFIRLSDLIASDLPLQGVGRIDISHAQGSLHITGTGFDDFDILLAEIATSDIAGPRTPRPRINADTEDDLRQQLAALMDHGFDLS